MQVHEKSILLPLVPFSMMANKHLITTVWISVVAVFSMGPLLSKDGLVIASVAVLAIYVCVVHIEALQERSVPPQTCAPTLKCSLAVSFLGMWLLALISKCCTAPFRWPYLWDAFIMTWSYLHIAAAFAYLYICG
jgi:alpha-1,3-glucosyltransferase